MPMQAQRTGEGVAATTLNLSSRSGRHIADSSMKYSVVRQKRETNHCCFSMATLNSFMLLRATCGSTVQCEHNVTFSWQNFQCIYIFDSDVCSSTTHRERTVAFPWQKRLLESAPMSYYIHCLCCCNSEWQLNEQLHHYDMNLSSSGLRYAAPRNGCEKRRGESAQKRFQSAQTLRLPSLHTSRPPERKQHIITSYTDR